jgi:ABC-type iron transport system FetAB ATPase subunit
MNKIYYYYYYVFMAENTTKMLWILHDNSRDMKHVQPKSILNSSEKSEDKYLAKNEEGETYKKKLWTYTAYTG